VRERLEEEGGRARERVVALEREFAGLAEAASAAGTDDEHDPEGATLAFERQHAAALLEAAREQVAAVDAALARLAAGKYGVCDRCGQPIGTERLAARPAATTCIRCARAGLAAAPGRVSRGAGRVSCAARDVAAIQLGGRRRCGCGRPSRPGRGRRRPR
jgi:RNA polymerase-binding transcription factor DksA